MTRFMMIRFIIIFVINVRRGGVVVSRESVKSVVTDNITTVIIFIPL